MGSLHTKHRSCTIVNRCMSCLELFFAVIADSFGFLLFPVQAQNRKPKPFFGENLMILWTNLPVDEFTVDEFT